MRLSTKLRIIFIASLISAFGTDISLCQIKANFSIDVKEGCGSLIPNITNKSETAGQSIKEYRWDLGGTFVASQIPDAPRRIFDKPGRSTICLTVSDQNGSTSKYCEDIVVYNNPVPDFEFDVAGGCEPLKVGFKNLSFSPNGKIIELTWDVGGDLNILKTADPNATPSTIYTRGGKKSVTLSVKDEKGCNSVISKKDIIEVSTTPEFIPNIVYLSTCGPIWQIELNNLNPDPKATYTWNLGNGESYNGVKPKIVEYRKDGVYDLTVKTTVGNCSKVDTFKSFINARPITAIEYSSDSLCSSISLEIRDISELKADSLIWKVSDGTIYRNEKTISHKFSRNGCNSVELFRYRNGCADTLRSKCIYVYKQEEISFVATNVKSCLLPTRVNLSGQGNGRWQWISGIDTLNSKTGNFVFQKFGERTIKLTVEDSNKCITEKYIDVNLKKFEVELPRFGPQGCGPLSFKLTDSIFTESPIVAYQWTIFTPNALKSNDKSPQFTVSDIGRFDVQLIVENLLGCIDTVFLSDYVKVGILPSPEFDASPLNQCRNVPRIFADKSSSNSNQWFWDFGDKSTSMAQNPSHTYSTFGTFDVTLTAIHNGCAATILKKEYIEVLKPISGLVPIYNCDNPKDVTFKPGSIGADSIYWVFHLSDTKRDTLRDSIIGSFVFPDYGKYLVTIYGKNFESGCEDTGGDTIFITNPKALYNLDTTKGCVPLLVNISPGGQDIDTILLFNQNIKLDQNFITFTTPGKYDTPLMIGKDRHGCPDTFQLNEPIIANGIKAILLFPKTVCVPDSILLLDMSLDTFAIIDKWEWVLNKKNSPLQNWNTSIDTAGFYDLYFKVTDSWGCTDELLIPKAIEGVKITLGIKTDTLGCTTSNLRLIASGNNTTTGSYLWEFGDDSTSTSPLFTEHKYLAEGEYEACLTMGDVRGCTKKVCTPIKIANPVANFVGTNLEAKCPELLSTFKNQSKNASYYLWDFGDNQYSTNKDPAHIYTIADSFDVSLIAYSSPNCSDTLTKIDYVKVDGPKAKIIVENLASCTPNISKISVETDRKYKYYWDDDAGNVEEANYITDKDSRKFTYTNEGTYNPRILVENEEGCRISFNAPKVNVNIIKAKAEVIQEPFCEGIVNPKIRNLTTSSSSENNFTWILRNKDTEFFNFDSLPYFNIKDTGYYELTLIAKTENCIDTFIKEKSIFVAEKPKADFSILTNPCQFTNIEIANNSYIENQGTIKTLWKFNNKDTSSTFNPLYNPKDAKTLNVNLLIVNEANCIDSIQKTIDLNIGLEVKLPNDTTICILDSVFLKALIIGNPQNSRWYNAINTVCNDCNSILVHSAKAQKYYFTASTTAGCIYKDSIEINVTPVTAPKLEILAPRAICKGDFVTLKLDNYLNDWKAIWSDKAGKILCEGKCDSISLKLLENTGFNVVVKNQYACTSTQNIPVDVEVSIPNFLVDSKIICEDDSVRFNVTEGVRYKWTISQYNGCDTCRSVSFKPYKNNQIVTVEIKSTVGCSYIDSVEVSQFPRNLIGVNQDTLVCKGQKVFLVGSGFGIPKWSSDQSIADANKFVASTIAEKSGYFNFQAQLDDCILYDSTYIKVMDRVSLSTINDTICPGSKGILRAYNDGLKITWLENNKVVNTKDTFLLAPSETKLFIIKAERQGCIPASDTVTLLVYPKVEYKITRRLYRIYENSLINPEIEYNEDKVKFYKFDWKYGDELSCTNCPLPFITSIGESKKYLVDVVDERYGCHISDSLRIEYFQGCTKEGFFIPNILNFNTPNNNTFFVKAVLPQQFKKVQVFDRWGNSVYESEDINGKWDGTIKGVRGQQGVYAYFVNAVCTETDQDYTFYGSVTLTE
jgi:PKD repeat protein